MNRSAAIALLGLAALPAIAIAQRQPPKTEPGTFAMPKEYRAVQLAALQQQRKLLLSFADSMPERLYRDKVTEIQRDFAQQVHHVARSSGFVGGWWLTATARNQTADDSVKAIGSRAGLKAYINAEYDYLEGMMKAQTDADRDTKVQFFGGAMIPKWQIWDELNQHAWWTSGQMVANFRKHGMTPPNFLFF